MKHPLNHLVCCGLTPCVQRVLEFSNLRKNAVNRARRVTVGIGGKGANTARIARQMGGEPLLVGFAGGANGRLLEKMLSEEGVSFRHVEVAGETRICQTLLEEGNPENTELVEEMPPVSEGEWERMRRLFQSLELSGGVVAIAGKLPAGVPEDAYAQMAETAAQRGARAIIDAPDEPLRLALRHRPFLVKINDEELFRTVGGDDLAGACRRLLEMGARSVLVTRGSRSALFADGFQTLEIFPPKIEAVNPVGSGDAVTAGIALELAGGGAMEEALRLGMACGAANALNLRVGVVRPEDVERLLGQVRMERIG